MISTNFRILTSIRFYALTEENYGSNHTYALKIEWLDFRNCIYKIWKLAVPNFSLKKRIFRLLFLGHTAYCLFSIAGLLFCRKNRGENKSTIHTAIEKGQNSKVHFCFPLHSCNIFLNKKKLSSPIHIICFASWPYAIHNLVHGESKTGCLISVRKGSADKICKN